MKKGHQKPARCCYCDRPAATCWTTPCPVLARDLRTAARADATEHLGQGCPEGVRVTRTWARRSGFTLDRETAQ